MRILILKPRLDCTFKKGDCPVQANEDNLPPIRIHWKNFVNKIEQEWKKLPHTEVMTIHAPLWSFTPGMVEELKPNVVYIPHKQSSQFPINRQTIELLSMPPQYQDMVQTFYYMQTVFPKYFSVDRNGWGAGSSKYPFVWKDGNPEETPIWNELKDNAYNNISKFDQPIKHFYGSNYILFVCQIPHDEVILHQSKVSVASALEETLMVSKNLGIRCIVKGHPINPGSMSELKEIQSRFSDISTWIDDCSIHSLIENSIAVFTVNSGVGYEAILHDKPIFCFGDVEYDTVVNKCEIGNSESKFKTFMTIQTNEKMKAHPYSKENMKINYRKFINSWIATLTDSSQK